MNDDYRKVNPVLRQIMHTVYSRRKNLPPSILTNLRFERVNDQAFCELWFMTKGCSHDAQGGCSMCNYGKGHEIEFSDIYPELQEKSKSLPEYLQELIVTPTGSMLDDDEVTGEFRRNILSLFSRKKCYDFFIETRADSITGEKLEELKSMVNARNINIEIGVECCDDWVLRNCVNKNMQVHDLERALALIHESGMYAVGNIGIGIPFMNERTAIELATASIRRLFDMGFDFIVLFPYHVKPGTLCAHLWEKGQYHCCSLWAIPEVLSSFSPDELERIQISWYRNYYTDKKKILESPDTDECSREKVLQLLDNYKNHPGAASLKFLLDYEPEDKITWKQNLLYQEPGIDPDEIRQRYYELADEFGIPASAMDSEWEYMADSYKGGMIGV